MGVTACPMDAPLGTARRMAAREGRTCRVIGVLSVGCESPVTAFASGPAMRTDRDTAKRHGALRMLLPCYAFAFAPLAACQAPVLPPPVQVAEFPGATWRTATPAEMSMDPALLAAGVARITS